MRHCSFCSLLCSYGHATDLADCSLRNKTLAELQNRNPRLPVVNSRESSLAEAVSVARKHLQDASSILVSGSIVSLEASRAAVELARCSQATIDLTNSQPAFDWLLALQSGGGLTTTINEAAFRGSALVFIGNDELFASHPLILDQLLECPEPLHQKRLVLLGEYTSDCIDRITTQARRHDVQEICTLDVSLSKLWQVMKACASSQLSLFDTATTEIVTALKSQLDGSAYSVLIFSNTISYPNGNEFYRSLNEFIIASSKGQKYSALPLASASLMFSQVCTWLTGFPGRVQFAGHDIDYNPWLHTREKYLSHRNNDSLIVNINESGANPNVEITKAGEIVVNIPLSICGLETSATFYKSDGSTMIYCESESVGVSAGQVLSTILADEDIRS